MVAININKALLFDSVNKIVKEVNYDNELDTLYVYLGCDCVDTIRLDENHIIFVDDEGLIKEGDIVGWIVEYKGNRIMFAGSGLLVGDNFGMPADIKVENKRMNIQCFRASEK